MSTARRTPRTASLIALFFVVAACSVTPPASPAHATPVTTADATAAPTAARTPATTPLRTPAPTGTPGPLGAAWTFVELGAGEIADIAHGDAGYVAVGSTGCTDGCAGSAGAWFSPDALTWSSATLPDGDDVYVHTVATDGSTWYAAGDRNEQTGLVKGYIWRSTDARTWRLIKSFDVGKCIEGCPSIGMLAARPGSALLTSPFGLVGATSDGYVLGAGKVVWETGGAADLVRRIDFLGDYQGGAIATDARRIVVLEALCGDTECSTRAWSSADGRTGWVSTDQPMPILWTQRQLLVVSGGSFITAGQRAPSGIGIYASRDGVAWTEIRSQLSIGGECGVGAMSGTGDQLVLAGCASGVWVSDAP